MKGKRDMDGKAVVREAPAPPIEVVETAKRTCCYDNGPFECEVCTMNRITFIVTLIITAAIVKLILS